MTKLNKVLIAVAGLSVLMLLPLTAMAQAPGGGPGWNRGGDQGGRGRERQPQRQEARRPEMRMSQVEILDIDEGEMLIKVRLFGGDREGYVEYHERTRFIRDGEKAEVGDFSTGDEVFVALVPPREIGDEFHLAFMGDEKPDARRERGREGQRGGQGERGEKLREMLKPVEVQVTDIDGDTVTIETEDGWCHTYKVGARARLFLNGEEAELSDFGSGSYFALAPGLKGEEARGRIEGAEKDLPLMLLCDEQSLPELKERFQQKMQERMQERGGERRGEGNRRGGGR